MHVYFEDWNVLGEMKQWSLRQHTEGIRALNSLASWIQRFIEGLQQWGTMILFLTCTNIGQFNHPGSDSTKALNTKLFIRRFNKLCKSCAFVSLVCLHLQFSDHSVIPLFFLRIYAQSSFQIDITWCSPFWEVNEIDFFIHFTLQVHLVTRKAE